MTSPVSVTNSAAHPAAAVASLLASFHQETVVLERFLALLQREATALLPGTAVETMNAVTQEKVQFAARLDASMAGRTALLNALGYAAGFAGAEQAVRSHPELADAWITLKQVANTAREQNDANGMTVNVQMEEVRRSMQALQKLGVAPAAVYDARGLAKIGGSSRSFVAS